MASVPLSSSFPHALSTGSRRQGGALLIELKKAERLTARELASRLGMSLNAVRHHLRELESEGLVAIERWRRGVGAPVFVYRLTQAAESLFPRRYEATVTDLLDHVVEREGRAGAVAVLEARYAALTRRLQEELDGASPAQRIEAVARLLTNEGYMAEANATDDQDQGRLTAHNCAIRAVAERFPEICAAEARFLSSVLGGKVERTEHILSGCRSCDYHVRFTVQSAPRSNSAPSS